MSEAAQEKVQKAVTALVDDIDRSHLRKLQKSMHLCAANCCDNEHISLDGVHRCTQNCSEPLNKAQNFVQGELRAFQERLSRCVADCQDKIKEKVTPDTTEQQAMGFKAEFEGCALVCVDEHIQRIPPFSDKIKHLLHTQYGNLV